MIAEMFAGLVLVAFVRYIFRPRHGGMKPTGRSVGPAVPPPRPSDSATSARPSRYR